jgi:hypothetical protein
MSHALVAVDATVETEIGYDLSIGFTSFHVDELVPNLTYVHFFRSKFSISGYPTIKYFFKGKFVEDYNGGRRKMDFVEFIKKKGNGNAKSSKDEL